MKNRIRFAPTLLLWVFAAVLLAIAGTMTTTASAYAANITKIKIGAAYYTCAPKELAAKQTVELWYAGPTNKMKASYTVPKAVKFKYRGRVKVGKVVAIDSYAFKGCKKAKLVSIKGNVRTIGYKAFCQCKNLKKVKGKDYTISDIGVSAFRGCKKLVSVPKLANKGRALCVGMNAFRDCVSLKSIAVKVTKRARGIGEYDWGVTFDEKAFYNCRSLKSIALVGSWGEESPTLTINENCFRGCKRIASIKNHNLFYLEGDGAAMAGTPLAGKLIGIGNNNAIDMAPTDIGVLNFGDKVTFEGTLQEVGDAAERSNANGYSNKSANANANGSIQMALELTKPIAVTLNGRAHTLSYLPVAVSGLGNSWKELVGSKAEISGYFVQDFATSWCPGGVKTLRIDVS